MNISRLHACVAVFAILLIAFFLAPYIKQLPQKIPGSRHKENSNILSTFGSKVNSACSNPTQDNMNIVDKLARDVELKLMIPPLYEHKFYRGCYEERSKGNSCNGTCLRMDISPDLRTRIAQIVEPEHLRIKPQHQKILDEMRSKVKGQYDIVILTGANSKFFGPLQTLFKSLHKDVYPFIQNFTVIVYDLGLTKEQRRRTEKHCKCQVVDFPFDKLPVYFGNLYCYTFKPVVINAHVGQGNVVTWLDTSITFPGGGDSFHDWLRGARLRGMRLQTGGWNADAASRTVPSAYHFFGEEACAYLTLGEIQAGLGAYSNEEFVKKLILDPWVACAFERSCMCPLPYPRLSADQSNKAFNEYKAGKAPMKYGLCHRFDQSALNILVAKLYRERYRTVVSELGQYLKIGRRVSTNYFP